MEKNIDIKKPRYSEQTLHVPCGGGPSLCRGSTFYYHHPYKPPHPLLLIWWEAHAQIAYSRLRDSRARGIDKARTRKKKKREETGERGRRRKWLQVLYRSLSLPFPFFPPRFHFRAPYTFASSPLSESLEQAKAQMSLLRDKCEQQTSRLRGKQGKRCCQMLLKLSYLILSYDGIWCVDKLIR